jgi:hypothetical protein
MKNISCGRVSKKAKCVKFKTKAGNVIFLTRNAGWWRLMNCSQTELRLGVEPQGSSSPEK